METLLIRRLPDPHSDSDELVEWQVFDSNLIPLGQVEQGSPTQAAEFARQRKVVFLAPAEQVLLSRVEIQTRNRQQLLKAVPYTLEEDLADDVENLHFALGPRQDDGSYPVAVIARKTLDMWLMELQEANIVPNAIFPELLNLPFTAPHWTLLLEDNRALIRSAQYHGFGVDADNLEAIFDLITDQAEEAKPDEVDVYRCDHETRRPLPQYLPVEKEHQHDHCLALMASGLNDKCNINLLQGSYKISDDALRLLKHWRFAAALFGVWLVIQFTTTAIDYWRLNQESEALQSRIEEVYRETFPEAQRVVNPRVQMEQSLKSLLAAQQGDDKGSFLPLLDAGGRAIHAISGIEINTLDYREDRLELALKASDLQALEKVKQRLEEEGLNARIESAETSGQQVEARLLVRRRKG